jgi:hypothetical protein
MKKENSPPESSERELTRKTPVKCVDCGWNGDSSQLITDQDGYEHCPCCDSVAGVIDNYPPSSFHSRLQTFRWRCGSRALHPSLRSHGSPQNAARCVPVLWSLT